MLYMQCVISPTVVFLEQLSQLITEDFSLNVGAIDC